MKKGPKAHVSSLPAGRRAWKHQPPETWRLPNKCWSLSQVSPKDGLCYLLSAKQSYHHSLSVEGKQEGKGRKFIYGLSKESNFYKNVSVSQCCTGHTTFGLPCWVCRNYSHMTMEGDEGPCMPGQPRTHSLRPELGNGPLLYSTKWEIKHHG